MEHAAARKDILHLVLDQAQDLGRVISYRHTLTPTRLDPSHGIPGSNPAWMKRPLPRKYAVTDIAWLWNLSADKVHDLFEDEASL